MISSKTNILKLLAMSMALFALPIFWVTIFFHADAKAAGDFPKGGMHEPPAITEIIPDAESLAERKAPSGEGTLVRNKCLGESLYAIPVETGDHYKYLSDAERTVYNALYRSIVSGNYIPYSQQNNTHDYNYMNTYKTLVHSGSQSFQDIYGLSSSEYTNILNRASEAIYFDHPDRVEFYMCHASHFCSVHENDTYYSYIVIYAGYDESLFSGINEQIKNALATWINELKAPGNNCVNYSWDALTELKVHDYYVSRLSYDTNCANDYSSKGYFNLAHTAYGALCSKKAVCDGFSSGFELILKELGIDSMIIAGYAKGGHAWNMVRLDGMWYEVDTTWALSGSGTLGHDWFNRTTAEYEAGLGSSSKAHIRKSDSAYIGFRMPRAYGSHYTYKYLTETAENLLKKDDEYVALQGISLSQAAFNMKVGESMVLPVTFFPENATIKDYSLSSSNYDCVEANGNTLTAVAAGNATITVTSAEGEYKTYCTITAIDPLTQTVESPVSAKKKGNKISVGVGSAEGVYVVTSSKKATVAYKSGISKNAAAIIIPSTITDDNGFTYTVTEVSANACKGYKKLKKVVIPETVTKIGKGAFKNCHKLSSVKILGKDLKKVESGAFKGAKKAVKITICAKNKRVYERLKKLIRKAASSDAVYKFKKKKS